MTTMTIDTSMAVASGTATISSEQCCGDWTLMGSLPSHKEAESRMHETPLLTY
jgi:hypothetical protein